MRSPPTTPRALWLALPLAAAGAVVAAEVRLSASPESRAAPPREPTALVAWLTERAPPVDRPALGEGAWPDLAGQPAIAVWAAEVAPTDALPPAVARGLAVHAVPPRVLRALGPDAGLDAESLALVLSPALADRTAGACPRVDPAVSRTLCSPSGRSRAEAGRDRALIAALSHPDADRALWAVELAAGLGADGARIGEAAFSAAQSDRARAHALSVLARTLPPAAAVSRLSRHTDPADPLAPLAILELSRLEGGAAALDAVPRTDPGLGVLADVARTRAEGGAAPGSSGSGLVDRGL